jgi:uncharacterized protein (DUF58 family)
LTPVFPSLFGWLVFDRRVVVICREGVYYVFVLAFIVGGATLRDINLLFLLAGIMVGPLLLNWRFVVLAIRELAVYRRLPDQIFAGRPFRVEVFGRNYRRRLGSWMLVVDDLVQPIAGGRKLARGVKANARVVFPYLAAGKTEKATYLITLPRRGRYQFGPMQVSTRFPMGLVKAAAKLKRYEQIVVWPRLGRLTPDWLRVMVSDRLGRQPVSIRQGPIEGDYFGLREWRPGDSKRWIHWRTTAKMGELAVRQFEQVHDQDLAMVLDLWQPKEPSRDDLGRVEMAVSFAATVVDESSRRKGSRLTLALAAKQRGNWTARVSTTFVRQTLEHLAIVEAASENRLDEVLGGAVSGLPAGAQLVVVSTRPSTLQTVGRSPALATVHRYQRILERVLWVDVGVPQVSEVFSLE